MIDWDEHGFFDFDFLDALEEFGEKIHRQPGLRFCYNSRSRTVIDGEIVRLPRSGLEPIVTFREYRQDMSLLFGITGRLLGSVVDLLPLTIAPGQVIPDTDLAVVKSGQDRIFTIPTPASQIHYLTG
jgi:hypothetical protein